jgi:hypothetical protein
MLQIFMIYSATDSLERKYYSIRPKLIGTSTYSSKNTMKTILIKEADI